MKDEEDAIVKENEIVVENAIDHNLEEEVQEITKQI